MSACSVAQSHAKRPNLMPFFCKLPAVETRGRMQSGPSGLCPMAIGDGRMPPPSPPVDSNPESKPEPSSVSPFNFCSTQNRIIQTYVLCANSDSLALILTLVTKMTLLHLAPSPRPSVLRQSNPGSDCPRLTTRSCSLGQKTRNPLTLSLTPDTYLVALEVFKLVEIGQHFTNSAKFRVFLTLRTCGFT